MSTATNKRLRIVVDTNIIVSALAFGGLPDRVILYCTTQQADLYISPFIRREAIGVLYQKLGWTLPRATASLDLLVTQAILIRPVDRLSLVSDEPDNRVLECAVASKAHYIVTGDKGLLALKTVQKTLIVTAADFLQSIN